MTYCKPTYRPISTSCSTGGTTTINLSCPRKVIHW